MIAAIYTDRQFCNMAFFIHIQEGSGYIVVLIFLCQDHTTLTDAIRKLCLAIIHTGNGRQVCVILLIRVGVSDKLQPVYDFFCPCRNGFPSHITVSDGRRRVCVPSHTDPSLSIYLPPEQAKKY